MVRAADPARCICWQTLQLSRAVYPICAYRAPRNLFALVDTAPHHVLLGAGIGITPMLSMAASLWQQAASFSLDYFSARAEGGAFSPLLRQSPYAKRVSIHEGRARTDIAVQLRERVAQCPSDAHIYVCGPDGFMASAVAITQELGAGARATSSVSKPPRRMTHPRLNPRPPSESSLRAAAPSWRFRPIVRSPTCSTSGALPATSDAAKAFAAPA